MYIDLRNIKTSTCSTGFDFLKKTKISLKKSAQEKKGEWLVDYIISHKWINKRVKFQVQWELGNITWESYGSCSRLSALDDYFNQQKVTRWQDLSKELDVSTATPEPELDPSNDHNNTDSDNNSASGSVSNVDNADNSSVGESDSETEQDEEHMQSDLYSTEPCSNDFPEDYHNWTSFMSTHLQSETHKVKVFTKNEALISDFIGECLPRKDKGNREDYCMTTLTLFKPWRTGLELKNPDQSWNEAFANHQWTECQQQLMKFFHIRYECNDARDDFSAQRKAKTKEICLSDLTIIC